MVCAHEYQRPVLFDFGDDPWRTGMLPGPAAPRRVTIVSGEIADREAVTRVVSGRLDARELG